MKNLIIIGARGLGREIYNMMSDCIGFGTDFVVKGYLDDKKDVLLGKIGYPPIIDSVENYEVQEDDVFFCALGDVKYKKKYCQLIYDKGGKFQTIVHKNAEVSKTAEMGQGCFIDRFALIGSDSKLGNNVLVQAFAIIGHDCEIGNFARIDTHCTCVGGTKIGDSATIYTNSVINEHVVVGDNAIVGACSFVIRKVKPNTTVQGNPARKVDF